MALYTDMATIGEVMAENDACYWRVWSSDNEVVANNIMVGKTGNANESYSKLSDFIQKCTGDYVKVKLWKRSPNKAADGTVKVGEQEGQQSFTYRVLLRPAANSPLAGVGSANGQYNDAVTRMEVMMVSMQKDREIEKLQAKIDQGINGFSYEKEIFGMVKEWFLKNKIESSLTASKEKRDSEDKEIATVEPGAIATAIGDIKGAMKDKTIDFIGAVGFFAKNSPEEFAAMAAQIMNGVNDFKKAHEADK